MSVYAPTIDFKTPTVDIAGGDAYTAAPSNYDTNAVSSASLQDPRFDFQGTEVYSDVYAPQGSFSTQAPSDYSTIQSTSDYKNHSLNTQYVEPSYNQKW